MHIDFEGRIFYLGLFLGYISSFPFRESFDYSQVPWLQRVNYKFMAYQLEKNEVCVLRKGHVFNHPSDKKMGGLTPV